MTAIVEAMRAAALHAREKQKLITASQWLAYRGRIRLGVESVGEKTVTKLDKTREDSSSKRTFAGILDLRVDVRNGPARVVGARAAGIDHSIAVHFDDMNLTAAHLPVRLIIGSDDAEPTIVTRDEGGRVRASGGLYHLAAYSEGRTAPTNEVQAERAARALCDHVLEKTLKDWGVAVETPDQKAARKDELKHKTAKQLGFGPSPEEIAGAEDSKESD